MNTDHLFAAVCQVCGCTKEEILSDNQTRYPVIARKIISAYRSHDTLCAVGKLINRNHATVSYYRRTYEADLRTGGLFREKIGKVGVIIAREVMGGRGGEYKIVMRIGNDPKLYDVKVAEI